MVIRICITLGDPHLKWLKQRAKELGISVSELIRRMVDEKRDA
jgi:hypothetical protein